MYFAILSLCGSASGYGMPVANPVGYDVPAVLQSPAMDNGVQAMLIRCEVQDGARGLRAL